MRISARCDYACRALLELSLHWPSEDPVHIDEISQKQDIPRRYLVQILLQLKRQGYLRSFRGKSGGYLLKSAPSGITLGDVVRSICGPLMPVAHSVKEDAVFSKIWDEAEDAVSGVLDRVTFEDIMERARGGEKALFYSI